MTVDALAYESRDWGTGEIWLEGPVLVHHELPGPRPERRSLPRRRGLSDPAPPALRLRDRLLAYFRGERDDFADVPLDLEDATPFARAVVSALRAVPYGEVVTYGELAALAGYPSAHRAAGTVCARNRFPIVVPCHRVVAASSLGRYGTLGTPYKRRLLALEGVRDLAGEGATAP